MPRGFFYQEQPLDLFHSVSQSISRGLLLGVSLRLGALCLALLAVAHVLGDVPREHEQVQDEHLTWLG